MDDPEERQAAIRRRMEQSRREAGPLRHYRPTNGEPNEVARYNWGSWLTGGDRTPDSFLGGYPYAAFRGMTLGGADELMAAYGAGLEQLTGPPAGGEPASPSESYDSFLGGLREGQRAFRRENPIMGPLTELVGGLANPIQFARPLVWAGQRAAQVLPRVVGWAPGLVGKTAAGGAEGAVAGGLGGFLEGEGDAGERLGQAQSGAGLGSAIGSVIPSLGALTRGIARLGSNVTGVGNGTAGTRAIGLIDSALERDNLTPDAVRQSLNGPVPRTLVDAADAASGPGGAQNTAYRARAVFNTPGEGRTWIGNVLRGRAEDQESRVVQAVTNHLTPTTDAAQTATALIQAQKAHADPLYQQARAFGVVDDPRLNPLVPRLRAAGVLQDAEHLAAVDGHRLTMPTINPQTGAPPVPQFRMHMDDLDYMKKALDARINASMSVNPATGAQRPTPETRALVKLKNDLLGVVDEINPAYAQARAVFSDDQQAINALADGRNVFHGNWVDFDNLVTRFHALDPGDQVFFRIGLGRSIMDKFNQGREGTDSVRRFFASRENQRRLREFFPSQGQFDDFRRAMEEEMRTSTRAGTIMGGSPTQSLLAEAESANDDQLSALAGTAWAVTGGRWVDAVKHAARGLTGRAQGITPAVSAQAGRRLVNIDRAANNLTLDEVEAFRRARVRAREDAGSLDRRLIDSTAGLVGRDFEPEEPQP